MQISEYDLEIWSINQRPNYPSDTLLYGIIKWPKFLMESMYSYKTENKCNW